MRPVVQEWDDALRAKVPAYGRLVPAAETRGSILRAPAPAEEIERAEKTLGVELPPSYRAFLSIADGADPGPRRANYSERLREPHEFEVLGVDGLVECARADISWLVDMWRGNMGDHRDRQEPPTADGPVQVYDFAPAERHVLITRPQQDGIVALVPFPGEWQVWEFFHTEVYAHESFASMLAYVARRARQAVVKRAERIRADSYKRPVAKVLDLAAHGDPRTVAVASSMVLDPGLSYDEKRTVAMQVSFVGDPAAIPALQTALERIDDPASATNHPLSSAASVATSREQLRGQLIEALRSCGDAHGSPRD
jgi:SMI1 / KNR4 family (SUKH-1)